MDPKLGLKDRLLEWFIRKQLSDYLNVFDASFEAAWIDKIDRRYSWMKKVLIQFEQDFHDTFPTTWAVDERICIEFCNITKRELSSIMGARPGTCVIVAVRILYEDLSEYFDPSSIWIFCNERLAKFHLISFVCHANRKIPKISVAL